MKYSLYPNSENRYLDSDIAEQILKNRGVEDPYLYISPSKKNVNHYSLLKNIQGGVEMILHHIENNNPIHIIVDPDTDGYTSSAILIMYLRNLFENVIITYSMHTGKQHGITKDIEIPNDCKLLIIPDAGTNQVEEHLRLKERGIDVLVLDHHESDKVSKSALVINNKMCDYPNKELSGVGIVYKLLQALDDTLWVEEADKYKDLVAIGLIGDSMDIRESETRYLITDGLKKITNTFLIQLIEKQKFKMEHRVYPITIAFYIVPQLNALIRIGSAEEKELVFKAILGEKKMYEYKPRGKDETLETLQERAVRICGLCKSRQDRKRDVQMPQVINHIEKYNLHHNKIVLGNATDIVEDTLIGIIAMKIADRYNKPCLLLRRFEEGHQVIYKGSGRNISHSPVKNLKDFLQSTNKVLFAEGHQGAFGVAILSENINPLLDIANKSFEGINSTEKEYLVDYIFQKDEFQEDIIQTISNMKRFWGHNVNESLIAIENISLVNKKAIGKFFDTFVAEYNEVKFIKFRCSATEMEKLMNTDVITIVGKCSVNEYNNQKTLQIQIEDWNEGL